jgi:DNA polymerase-4
MDLPLNYNPPLIMHIDLNSCFAIIEQQANPLIRNKPVAIAAYDTPRGAVIASSYEAKALGIKLGVNVREARMLYRDVIVMMPDPDKYFDAHRRFKKVLLNYTDEVTPKSVDEFVIDFRGSRAVQRGKSLTEVGLEIKEDIKKALGEYVTVNIGIGTNRFLAKLAAGLNKPDGMDVITGETIRDIYERLSLTDLPGINVRFQARLNVEGIYTPLQFLESVCLEVLLVSTGICGCAATR